MLRLLCLLTLLSTGSSAQTADPLTPRLAEVFTRESNGHSPTTGDIAAFTALTPAPDDLAQALPILLKLLDNPDTPARTLALTTLNALQVTAPADQPQPAPPAAYKSDIARILAVAIPRIATRLTDESEPNRVLAATALGGFFPDPPSTIYPPLLAYLKRDDAVNPVGLLVVNDLLQLGPLYASTADAISRYLRRADQTSSSRSDIVEAIASHPNQSQSLNKTLLSYLSSDDASLRARLILSLPALDLTPDDFAATKTLVSSLASFDPAGGQDNLQVINAAKAVATCWTAVRMASGCPVY